ncbi:MAG: response regulator [Candidatus Peregrinibacteria bacterium]
MDKHILIAEDDLFLVKMYKLELEGAGYEVTTVTNGKLALEAIEKQKPDLLLLDLLMPEVDGFTVLQQIQMKGYVFPVVVLSSSSQEIDKKKCKALGATDYIVKSDMELDQLAKMIKRYV